LIAANAAATSSMRQSGARMTVYSEWIECG
jgi:hypothetical protein